MLHNDGVNVKLFLQNKFFDWKRVLNKKVDKNKTKTENLKI